MDSAVPESVTWREVRDPVASHPEWRYAFHAIYRCRYFQLEFRWSDNDRWTPFEPEPGTRYAPVQKITVRTPEREAVWLDLFLRP